MKWMLLLLVVFAVGCGGKKNKAVEPCSACGESVSVKADKCPHCGEPNPTPTKATDAITDEFRKETDDMVKEALGK